MSSPISNGPKKIEEGLSAGYQYAKEVGKTAKNMIFNRSQDPNLTSHSRSDCKNTRNLDRLLGPLHELGDSTFIKQLGKIFSSAFKHSSPKVPTSSTAPRTINISSHIPLDLYDLSLSELSEKQETLSKMRDARESERQLFTDKMLQANSPEKVEKYRNLVNPLKAEIANIDSALQYIQGAIDIKMDEESISQESEYSVESEELASQPQTLDEMLVELQDLEGKLAAIREDMQDPDYEPRPGLEGLIPELESQIDELREAVAFFEEMPFELPPAYIPMDRNQLALLSSEELKFRGQQNRGEKDLLEQQLSSPNLTPDNRTNLQAQLQALQNERNLIVSLGWERMRNKT